MVKQGYKQTEVGVIPEDWDVRKIGDFTDATAGGTPSTSHPEYWNGEILWMSSGELNKRRINNVIGRITELGYNNSSTHMIPENCVLIGLAGQGKTRGTVAVNYVELCTNQSIAAIFPSKEHNTEYLYQNLWSRYEELRELSSGDGGRGGLNLTIIKNFPCAFPKLQEQNRIAEALSDVDSMISSLEKLIAKKKAVKQGAMQELLTGKKRLPGFTGVWEMRMFRDICFINAPMVDPTKKEYEYLPHIGNESIEKGNGRISHYNIVKEDNLISGKYYFSHTDVLYGKINPQFAKAAYPQFNGLCSADMYPISCGESLNPTYLLYILLSEDFTKYTVSLSNRSGIPKVNREELAEYSLKLPSPKEQAAIASILSDMDNELEALEQKLAKTRQIKQGMMQQLLTGKIRLV